MFFRNKENKENQNYLIKICALLIHAAKIDENFSEIEEEIIKKTLLKLGSNQINIDKTIKEGKIIEENSNQILDFTKEVKNLDEINKLGTIEALWTIIYSNKEVDIYGQI